MQIIPNKRLKLLYIMRILLERSDERHPLTIADITAALESYGISADRKTIYADIELLRIFGMDIEMQRGKITGYYVTSRQFELPELKLLVDAVQSSRFITEKKSQELIGKLASLTSVSQAKELKRQVIVSGRAKAFNESAYYSVDAIHAAINGRTRISFKYFDYNVQKERIYRKNGELYVATPVALCWSEDKYYLIAYSAEYDELRHYRVDRMCDVTTLDEQADDFDRQKFDVSLHIRRVFGMYNGELVNATLSFDNSLVNVVLDHFGKDIRLFVAENGWFEVRTEVLVSPVFLAWMFMFGDKARIVAPESLINTMQELIESNAGNYSSG